VSVELNHTIIHCRERQSSAEFLAAVLGLEVGTARGPFLPGITWRCSPGRTAAERAERLREPAGSVGVGLL
jgi:hypothetical protein